MTESETPEKLIADLLLLLDLEPRGTDRYEGRRKQGGVGRVFGGQVIAQALIAAERTVADDRAAHSLHAYFLRGGSEDHPIDYAVDRQFDGGSFSNRRVVASQQGTAIFNMAVSFQRQQKGLEHQVAVMPDVPPPETLETDDVLRARYAKKLGGIAKHILTQPRPIEIRAVTPRHWMSSEPHEPFQNSWFRAKAALPDDPRIHRAVLAYFSDMQLLGTAIMPHGLSWIRGEVKSASLDHAVWFHDDFRADDWLLYATDSPWSGGNRGFNRGQIFTADGRLVASVAPEGMIRKVEPKR